MSLHEERNIAQGILASRSVDPNSQVTIQFRDWWSKKHENYFKENQQHLVNNVILPPPHLKLPKNKGDNQGGKKLCLIEEVILTSQNDILARGEESSSNVSDHHWKRPSKKVKTSKYNFFRGAPNASKISCASNLLVRIVPSHVLLSLFFFPNI